MRKEIKEALFSLDLKAKKIRKEKGIRSIVIIGAIVILYTIDQLLIPVGATYPILLATVALAFVLVLTLGGLYVFFLLFPWLIQPLSTESYAFKHITKSIKILEESSTPEAFEEASKEIKAAGKLLRNANLYDRRWYVGVNGIIKRFSKNMQQIVYPTVCKLKIKIPDLEDIAIALARWDSTEIEKLNARLETEPTYEKIEPPLQTSQAIINRLRENRLAKMGYSLVLGYALILAISGIYVVATGQDFLIFVRTNPAIVIGGGLGLSGITFWKT
jgi:hypothetical protein